MKDYEIDIICNYINYLLKNGQFVTVDVILDSLMDCDTFFNKDEVLSYLTATLPVKSKLKNRKFLFEKVKKFFTKEELDGLE